ncbi:MAG: site-specific integrase [Deltaproteobacteria bacterium]|nr:site-specific integrase [Deltaproteobacteria bacterium]
MSMHKVKAGHLIRLLGGNHNVNSLKLDDVAAYIDTRKVEGACTNTIAKELITLRAALRVARKRGVYDGHPEDLIPTGFSPHYVPRKRWLSPAEFEKLLLQLPADRRAHVAIMVFTGVRLSESAALRPEHVDIEKRRLYIPGTKTEQAGTTVPLAAAAVPWLMALLGHRPAGQAELLTPWRNIRRDLRLACDKAEIDPVSPNDLRRTFSSWLEQAGVPRGTNARLMRHTTTAMVDKVYAQSAFETLSAAADLLPAGPTVSVGLLPAPPESRPDKVASDGAKK